MSVDAGSRWRRVRFALPVALVIHLLFWVSLPTGLLDPVFNDSVHRIGKGGDFLQFYQAGSNLLRGRSIYQSRSSTECRTGRTTSTRPCCRPPSASAHRFWRREPPMRCGAIRHRRSVRRPANSCCGAWSARTHFPAVLCLSLAFTPVLLELFHGQTNCLMAVLLDAWFRLGLAARSAPARRARPSGQLQREAQHPSCY